MRFSKWRVGSNLLYYVSTRADDLLVGRYLGRRSLGNYRIAYRLANVPTTEIVSVLESVAFPALAVRARESPASAIATYPRYLALTCGLAGPMAAVFAALAQPLVADVARTAVRRGRGAARHHVHRGLPAGPDQHRRLARAGPRTPGAGHL